MSFKNVVIFFSVICSLLASRPAMAMHENDHRFKVYGTVYNDDGSPKSKAKVLVVLLRDDQGETLFTDSNGHYEVVFHMHDSNLGDEIMVTADGVSRKITAEFTPGDASKERASKVDFGTKISRDTSGNATAGDNYMLAYGAAGAAVAVGAFLLFGKKKKLIEENDSKGKKTEKRKK